MSYDAEKYPSAAPPAAPRRAKETGGDAGSRDKRTKQCSQEASRGSNQSGHEP
jgi:hypothetical protein